MEVLVKLLVILKLNVTRQLSGQKQEVLKVQYILNAYNIAYNTEKSRL